MKIHKSFLGFFWVFLGVGVVRFFSKFRIQSRMILVNSVPNPKKVAPKLQKLSHRKVSINVGHRTTTNDERRRHQSGKNYSLVEMKFRRDKNPPNIGGGVTTFVVLCRAESPFRGALGNLGVRGPQTPSLPPNQPSNNPFTAIFYTPFLNL